MLPKNIRAFLPWLIVLLCVGSVAFTMTHTTPQPNDDFFPYQAFIESLARGTLDFSIPGFHGMNIVAVPWYWLTRSSYTQIEFQLLSGMLLPLFAFLAARSLFRSTWHGVIFAVIITMMPFLAFGALRGWMVGTYHCLVLLTIFLAAERSRWAWLTWGFAMISLPFALALLPLLVTLSRGDTLVKRYWQIVAGLSVPAVYLLLQIAQTGDIQIGVHDEFTATSIWASPVRLVLNSGHALQMLFSVHNFYYPDPAKTSLGNMLHTSPLLVFLGLAAFLSWKTYFREHRLAFALMLGAFIGIAMNIMIDHMDQFYIETGLLFFILGALPVLRKQPLWIPIVLATLHFQWFYFYLQFRSNFHLDLWFFSAAAVVDLIFIVWCLVRWKFIQKFIQDFFTPITPSAA